jgi:hypothetical protein
VLKEIEAHLKGLIAEIDIQQDIGSQIAINIMITDRIETLAISEKRVYHSTSVKGDQGDYVFMSISREDWNESFLDLEKQ